MWTRFVPALFLALPLLALPLIGRPAAAEDEGPPAWFANVADAVGLGGVKAKDAIFTDLDGDGFLDLCLDRQRCYLSKARGTRFEPHATGIDAFVPQYLYFADVDNDGDVDAVYGIHSNWETWDGKQFVHDESKDHGHRSKVYLNDGEGRFTAAPASPFAAKDAAGPAMALALLDVDGDGLLDLYEGREYRQYGVLYGCGVDRLWKGDGKGGFTDVTEAAGLMTVPEPGTRRSSRPSYGVTHADVDGDGWQDLLQLAYGRQWNYLWRNRGDGTFEEVGEGSGYDGDAITHGRYPAFVERPNEKPFRSNGNTFDCAVGDIDNDGDLDLFLGEITHFWAGEASDLPALLVNQGGDRIRFERRTVRDFLPERTFRGERWNYGDLHVAFADVDNDTRLDLLIGSGDYPDGQFLRLYQQQPDGSFVERTEVAGFDWEGCGDLSIGDFDRDGDVDVLAGRSFARLNKAHREKYMGAVEVNAVGLFRNDVGNRSGNHWLNVRLVGKGQGGANRDGIGARVVVTTGDLTQIREIRAGSGLANHQDALEAHFGLGDATVVDRLEVRWGAGQPTQVFETVPADRFVVATQGRPRLALSKD